MTRPFVPLPALANCLAIARKKERDEKQAQLDRIAKLESDLATAQALNKRALAEPSPHWQSYGASEPFMCRSYIKANDEPLTFRKPKLPEAMSEWRYIALHQFMRERARGAGTPLEAAL